MGGSTAVRYIYYIVILLKVDKTSLETSLEQIDEFIAPV